MPVTQTASLTLIVRPFLMPLGLQYGMKGNLYSIFLVGNYTTDKYVKYKITVWLRAGGDNGCHSRDTTYTTNVDSLDICM